MRAPDIISPTLRFHYSNDRQRVMQLCALARPADAGSCNAPCPVFAVSPGAGNLFGPTLGKLLVNLKASGYEPDQIHEIYPTHLHPDHVGGFMSDGHMAFPNATARADQRDSDYWLSQSNMEKAPESAKKLFQGATVLLKPYIDAHRYQPLKGNTELSPGISAYSSYGHTVGRTGYVIESQGEKLIVAGDLVHAAAVQFQHPGVTISFDTGAKAAMKTRNKVFTKAAKDGELVAAAHSQFPGLGHLRIGGKSYQWIPVNYTRMR